NLQSSAASTSSNASSQSASSFVSKSKTNQNQSDKNQSKNPSFSYTRAEKSLTALTTKFMTLLQECENGILDLRSLVESIPSRQKRRVYDITNVLEGIGLIEKYSVNSIRCKYFLGGGPQTNSAETYEQLTRLKSEIDDLDKLENSLDAQIKFMQTNKKILLDDDQNKKNCYVEFRELIKSCSSDTPQSIILVKLNKETVIEVPEPMYIYNNSSVKQKYQVTIKDNQSPVDVYLCNEKVDKSDNQGEENNQNNEDSMKKELTTISKENLILLTPGPSSRDYLFTMDKNEGLVEMFDIFLE
ncbi:unnamed protein product, partial [Brachionus calyciflorus]